MNSQPPAGPFQPPIAGWSAKIADPIWNAAPRVVNWLAPAPVPQARARIAQLYERGVTSVAMSFHAAGLDTLKETVSLAPDHAGGWRALADLLRLAGQDGEADEAAAKADALTGATPGWPDAQGERSLDRLEESGRALMEELASMTAAQRIGHLRDRLFADPLDVVAMRALSREEELAGDAITAASLLERALALSPNYLAARLDYTKLLAARRDHLAVIGQCDDLLAGDPGNLDCRLLRAHAAVHMERFGEAVAVFETVLEKEPRNPHVLMSYGNVLRAMGRRQDSVRAYRSLLSVAPASGNAYFGLSELKADYLGQADIAAMRAHLADGITDTTSRKCMAYALGQALERDGDYEGSFEVYAYAAHLCKDEVANTSDAYRPKQFEQRLNRFRGTFTEAGMATRAAPPGAPATTPIFIVGMPRAGSTLVEQILASHSLVESTRELPVIANLTRQVAMSRLLVCPDVYPERVPQLDQAQRVALGEECLRGIAEYRKTTRPFVIDKRPWNWLDAAFIHLILPQAKFIDIRRAPMAAGFAMFKQLLPSAAAFSFDLRHLGHYYRSYVEFMTYLDTVMPGAILRVSYERLVDDTETQIRRNARLLRVAVRSGLPALLGVRSRGHDTERRAGAPADFSRCAGTMEKL